MHSQGAPKRGLIISHLTEQRTEAQSHTTGPRQESQEPCLRSVQLAGLGGLASEELEAKWVRRLAQKKKRP